MIRLEALFQPSQRARLAEAVWTRYSCRLFDQRRGVSAADWAALSYAAQRYAMPGARLALLRVEEGMFSGNMLGVGRITGCTTAAAVIASPGAEHSRVHAGILGEAFALEAYALGLACCWVNGTYRKKSLQLTLAPDEAVLAVIAFGVPSGNQPPIVRRRKPLEKICGKDVLRWPDEMRRVAEAVRQAPSSMNLQPWELYLSGERLTVSTPDRAQIELGVALCHAELMLQTPHTWHFGAGKRGAEAWAQPK